MRATSSKRSNNVFSVSWIYLIKKTFLLNIICKVSFLTSYDSRSKKPFMSKSKAQLLAKRFNYFAQITLYRETNFSFLLSFCWIHNYTVVIIMSYKIAIHVSCNSLKFVSVYSFIFYIYVRPEMLKWKHIFRLNYINTEKFRRKYIWTLFATFWTNNFRTDLTL